MRSPTHALKVKGVSKIALDRLDWMQDVHSRTDCAPHPCAFHAPSEHSMDTWPISIRWDRSGLVERHCPKHGTGHPDPDWLAFAERSLGPIKYANYAFGVHGCCGCCHDG